MRQRFSPVQIYLAISFCTALFFSMMAFISGIYRVETAQLDPLQLILLGTALEGAIFIFEVPTGIVADLFSRRLSVLIGYVIIGLGFILEGVLPFFATILVAQAIWGIGYTFISGAQDAWLADEIGTDELTDVYVRASQYGRIGGVIGLLASASLGLVGLALPFIVSGVSYLLLALFLSLFMPETGFKPVGDDKRNSYQKMRATFTEGISHVKGRPTLQLILLIGLCYGLYSEGTDRLTEAHILRNFELPFGWDAVVWFLIMSVAISLIGYVVNEIIRRRIDVNDLRKSLLLQVSVNLLLMVAISLFALAPGFAFAYSSAIVMSTIRGVGFPYFGAWTNMSIGDSSIRATLLSMNGQVNAIGQFIGGPIIGVVGRYVSLRAGLLTMLVFLAPVIWLYQIALRRQAQPAEVHP